MSATTSALVALEVREHGAPAEHYPEAVAAWARRQTGQWPALIPPPHGTAHIWPQAPSVPTGSPDGRPGTALVVDRCGNCGGTLLILAEVIGWFAILFAITTALRWAWAAPL